MHSPSLYRAAAGAAALASSRVAIRSLRPATATTLFRCGSTAEQVAGGAMANHATSDITASGALRLVVGKDTLIIDSVRVVLAQVTLARTATSAASKGTMIPRMRAAPASAPVRSS